MSGSIIRKVMGPEDALEDQWGDWIGITWREHWAEQWDFMVGHLVGSMVEQVDGQKRRSTNSGCSLGRFRSINRNNIGTNLEGACGSFSFINYRCNLGRET